MCNITHELDWLTYFARIAECTNMPEYDYLAVCEAFLKTILPQQYKTRIDGSPWPKGYGPQ